MKLWGKPSHFDLETHETCWETRWQNAISSHLFNLQVHLAFHPRLEEHGCRPLCSNSRFCDQQVQHRLLQRLPENQKKRWSIPPSSQGNRKCCKISTEPLAASILWKTKRFMSKGFCLVHNRTFAGLDSVNSTRWDRSWYPQTSADCFWHLELPKPPETKTMQQVSFRFIEFPVMLMSNPRLFVFVFAPRYWMCKLSWRWWYISNKRDWQLGTCHGHPWLLDQNLFFFKVHSKKCYLYTRVIFQNACIHMIIYYASNFLTASPFALPLLGLRQLIISSGINAIFDTSATLASTHCSTRGGGAGRRKSQKEATWCSWVWGTTYRWVCNWFQ